MDAVGGELAVPLVDRPERPHLVCFLQRVEVGKGGVEQHHASIRDALAHGVVVAEFQDADERPERQPLGIRVPRTTVRAAKTMRSRDGKSAGRAIAVASVSKPRMPHQPATRLMPTVGGSSETSLRRAR